MGERTGIEWTNATWNPMTGCTKVSAGCDHCYAAIVAERKLRGVYLARAPVKDTEANRRDPFAPRFWPDRLDQPLRWRTPRRVFVNSMSDVFHAHFSLELIQQVFAVMNTAGHHQFQVLTKRSERMATLSARLDIASNVWMGVSVENQKYTSRIDDLRRVEAVVRFLSIEPLLGPVEKLDLRDITLVVHDFGGPIALPIALRNRDLVKRVVIINSWMWSFAGDRDMEGKARIAGSAMGRFLYRWANFSLRTLMPGAYGDRTKLTPEIHRQYLERFLDRDSRGEVLWALARSLLGSSAFYDALWRERDKLANRPALIVWGMKDSAFRPNQLARWRTALPAAKVVELENAGHWPHEEEPDRVIAALEDFLAA